MYANKTLRTIGELIAGFEEFYGGFYPSKPYWGTLHEKMIRDLHGNPNEIIDPFNRDKSLGKLRIGPRYNEDGAWITVKGGDFYYYTDGKEVFILISKGPDEDLDLSEEKLGRLSREPAIEFAPYVFSEFCWDPTNGMTSNGDIFRRHKKE